MLDAVVEGKMNQKLSKWSQIFDLLCDIIDPYYVLWMVGVVLSSPVSVMCLYTQAVLREGKDSPSPFIPICQVQKSQLYAVMQYYCYIIYCLILLLFCVLQDVFYHVGFCILSLLGVYSNYFYFSAHLIYLVTSFKLLRTVLKSVLNNWKQVTYTMHHCMHIICFSVCVCVLFITL